MSYKVNLKIAKVALTPTNFETGHLLRQMLTERGIILDKASPITICYGLPHVGNKVLNGNVGGGDKILRLNQMKDGGVRTVPWFKSGDPITPSGFKFPALARKISGHGGEDIMPVFQAQEVPWRIAAGWDWFSSYVPFKTEYRVWVFRGEILDVYEKVMQRPEEYVYVAGRNFRQGFEFKRVADCPVGTYEQARKVLKACQFDFAAVDMLYGEDGKMYVLEANTAPGVIRSGAQDTLAKLADRMVSWVQDGCPTRGY